MVFELAAFVTVTMTMGAAPLLGMLHALEPGHGKSLVAAYLVGTGGKLIDALLLGVIVTVTHTAAAILLAGIVSLFHLAYEGQALQRALQLAAAALVTAIGVWMFHRVYRRGCYHLHGDHDHSDPAHRCHADEHGHEAAGQDARGAGPGGGNLRIPPGQRTADAAGSSGQNASGPGGAAMAATAVSRSLLGRGGLVGLGISSGMVPCPAALAVVVSVLNRSSAWAALATVLLFSAGMGAVLGGIGVAVIKLGHGMERRLGRANRFLKYTPLVSAGLVTLMGLTLLAAAIWWPEWMMDKD